MNKAEPIQRRIFQGALAFVAGASLFSLSTVFIKYLTILPQPLSPFMAAFSRFFIGLVLTGGWAWFRRINLRPHNPGLVAWRGGLNTAAIILFYGAVQFTTVTNTNVLNLMYPVWILIAGPLITQEKSPRSHFLWLILTLAGAWLITNPAHLLPGSLAFNIGDAMALASGIVAAFGIAVLRQARKFDGTVVVIFWLFAIGSLITVVPALVVWQNPADLWSWALLIGAGTAGFVGQVLITYGYRWVSAAQGSLLSASGILISALLGAVLFADPLNAPVVIGGLLILASVFGVSGIISRRRP